MNKYKVTITLKNGIVRKHRVKEEKERIDKIFKMIIECWRSVGDMDGYVSFKKNHYQISEIAHYSVKKVWF